MDISRTELKNFFENLQITIVDINKEDLEIQIEIYVENTYDFDGYLMISELQETFPDFEQVNLDNNLLTISLYEDVNIIE